MRFADKKAHDTLIVNDLAKLSGIPPDANRLRTVPREVLASL